jgi:hypothetical protein
MRGTDLGLDHDPPRVGTGLRPAALIAAAAWIGATAAPALGQEVARLPSIATAPAPGPPLTTAAIPLERRLPGPIGSHELVLVELGPAGTPVAIRVRQRLTVHGKGDYSLSIPAPLISVGRASGSESEPGGRRGLLLWQGFSPSRRVLAADARLMVAAGRYLPLRFSVRRGPRGRELIVRNVTGATVRELSFDGSITPIDGAAALDALRAALMRDRPAREHYVTVRGLRPGKGVRTGVPMRVEGSVRVAGRDVRFAQVVPGDRALVVELPPGNPVRVTATAVPVAPLAGLRPPGAPSWAAAAKTGRLRGGRALLARVLAARLQAARYRQYTQFLANPDRFGEARAQYVFRTASQSRPQVTATSDDGSNALLTFALAAGVFAAGVALLVWWAHS